MDTKDVPLLPHPRKYCTKKSDLTVRNEQQEGTTDIRGTRVQREERTLTENQEQASVPRTVEPVPTVSVQQRGFVQPRQERPPVRRMQKATSDTEDSSSSSSAADDTEERWRSQTSEVQSKKRTKRLPTRYQE